MTNPWSIDGVEMLRLYMYKDQFYFTQAVWENCLSQDSEGNWVSTVLYRAEPDIGKQFVRPSTDFVKKFSPIY